MPTPDQLDTARKEGMSAAGDGIGTHTVHGKHRCPYSDPELIAAWLEGYDVAIKRMGRTV